MRLSLLISLPCLALLAACASGSGNDADLALACQLQECNCIKDGSSIFAPETAEILWHPDGRAYCPEGHHLEAVGKDD